MERDMSQNTTLCRSGCGFYGSAATDGLCSKCFKDALKRKQAAPTSAASVVSAAVASAFAESSSCSSMPVSAVAPSIPSAIVSSSSAHFSASSSPVQMGNKGVDQSDEDASIGKLASADVAQSESTSDQPKVAEKKKKTTRCSQCKVKVGVIGFPCRCGGLFCSVHRYANEHSCSFDYKEHGAEEIRKNNPQVVGEKISKI